MTQNERIDFLIEELKKESGRNNDIPYKMESRKDILRSLINTRMPKPTFGEFLRIQDEFLQEELQNKGLIRYEEIPTIKDEFMTMSRFSDKISIWQGDITRLAVDAIVNAANPQLLGCFFPCHRCIDNAIHSSAGIQLREECFCIMEKQGHEEKIGKAKITKAYNLPCKHIIHTVGPIVRYNLTRELGEGLCSCYRSCIACAIENEVRTIAFCCISTGEYHFPHERAAQIAAETVLQLLETNSDKIDRVVFNVFQDVDYQIYKEILQDHM